ncbi:MAG: tetratricopeptide repeat protein [Gemmatimonadaceae bacterium]|nr:tetratricopeptide repeat protein [Gemmatimonadaceae bacterium]
MKCAAAGILVVLAGCATAKRESVASGVAATPVGHATVVATQEAVLARADSAWRAGSYPLATVLYETAIANDASTSVALFRLATLRSWDNRLDESVRLFRRYVALEPRDADGSVALARVLAWSGKYSPALAIYDSVITRGKVVREAVMGRAETLAWSGRLDQALTEYKRWITDHPTDREASLEYARALSWNGQLDESERIYTSLAGTGDIGAQKGLARIAAWRGELRRSTRAWRQIVDFHPTDAEALTGLAQVLSWQGRQSEAKTMLGRALNANPDYGDARALLRWVDAELRPSVTIASIGTNDSDHNKTTTSFLEYAKLAGWNTTLGSRYTNRRASVAGIDARADALDVFSLWHPGTWQLRADAGVSRHWATLVVSPARPRTISNAALHASGSLGRVLTVGAGASRAPFDETALLIANGIVSSEYSGEAEFALPKRFALAGEASHARLTRGVRDNSRNAFASTLRWAPSRRWSLAVGARQFGYDTTSSDGYFAPRKYVLTEASGRGRVGQELGWNADADVGIGRQRIKFFGFNAGSRLAERFALSAGYRFDPAREIRLSGGYANVAAPGQTGGSEYSSYSFALRARMGF